MTSITSCSSIRICHASTQNIHELVATLREALPQTGLVRVLVFVSPSGFNLQRLGEALYELFGERAVGCTSAGQFGPMGYQARGLMALGFYGDWFMRACLVSNLKAFHTQSQKLDKQVAGILDEMPEGMTPFGLVFVDGLSLQEERVIAHLHRSLTQIPVVGGSAGDELVFREACVLHNGRFIRDAALLLLCGTTRSLTPIQAQHHVPTEVKLVVTEADPEHRRVIEFNGFPAARAYSEAIGLPEEALCPTVFSQRPLTLTLGETSYIRSIQALNDDGSLSFYCAVEEGLVLSVARPVSPLEEVECTLEEAKETLGQSPEFILGFDCILRRLEFEASETKEAMEKLFVTHGIAGFFTFGEQIDGLHVNQTLTGIAFGEERR